MKKTSLILITLLIFCVHNLIAQSENPDFARSLGKIYIVVAVIVAMFLGIVFFLLRLDNKLTKLENQIKEHE